MPHGRVRATRRVDMVDAEPVGEDYAVGHGRLRASLKDVIAHSITSAELSGRTVEDPAQAAEYAVNALMEWSEGKTLLRHIAAHLRGLSGE